MISVKYYHEYSCIKKSKKGKNQECSWKEKFEFLHIFKETYGHVNVPQRYQYDPGLGSWVGKQRGYYSNSKLSCSRIDLLNMLGFEWAPGKSFSFDAAWNKRYEELKYFKSIYGHSNVPCKYKNNRELGFWVKNQRQFYRKKLLETNRIFLLNSLGFEWTRRETPVKLSWNERYREYQTYISKYGNGLVPQRSGPLGKWVQKQRDLFRKNLIKKERKDLLDSNSFVWEPRKNISKKTKNQNRNFIHEDFFFFQESKQQPTSFFRF
ncbi:hypothetical protein HAN_2g228 (nucleomorph) [Hemiselmis andersenii]|uniref:Helicase-associated domain-containing protein n=1 Tax=Hemiselmis andersenii TaxID=464988 RepID=A9BKP9_HEMAN|nr:hypothetical protein HAN_2g228 [Hemiselmis andersenii]ABW98054.1 hypothetical protein HAN_2g228 [Hemiselmis andersenii]|mmetsp:Transcript_23510/g.54668  ORF Transcript_23510/g.54668 Transcript_23510/m.54668 type:complete len:265 (+) Transcript_23510:95-889(+)